MSSESARREALLRKLKEDLDKARHSPSAAPASPRLSEPVAVGLPAATLAIQGGTGSAVGAAVSAGLLQDQYVASIRARAQALLQGVADDPSRERVLSLAEEWRPAPPDFAAAFSDGASEAEASYAGVWTETPLPLPGPGQTGLIVTAGTPEMLLASPVLRSAFPGSYAEVLPRMVPGHIWIRWKFVRPGATSGMAYDGLVWLGDRFRWFPKPWRLFP